jgi:uncharacterized iron-regulated membrane protein
MAKSTFKKISHWLHLFLGLVSGLVVFIVALTGCIYAFEKEIRQSLYADLYFAKSEHGQKINVDTLLSQVREKYPKQIVKTIFFYSDSMRSIQFNLKSKKSIFLHPNSGKLIGELNSDKDFLGWVLKVHRQLCLGDVGKIITGTSALIFLFSLITGLILWWPRSKRSLKHKLRITSHHGGKRLALDLHSTLGFYASWVLIISSLTGLIFAFKWFEKGMYIVTGSEKKEQRYVSTPENTSQTIDLNALYNNLRTNYPSEQIVFVLPEDQKGAIRASITIQNQGFFIKQDHFFYDQFSGTELAHNYNYEQSTGEHLRINNYNIHTGKVLGLGGEIVIFLAGLVAASLPVTGIYFWWCNRKKN